ncbi:MAG: peptidoglycan DD-metalloendopeptidase family protein [Pseudomonadota bacterium]
MLSFIKTDSRIIPVSVAIGAVFWILLSGVLAAEGVIGSPPAGIGIITAWKLNIRTGPSEEAPVAGLLSKEARVSIMGETDGPGGWFFVVSGDLRGYVRNRPQYIRVLEKSGNAVGDSKGSAAGDTAGEASGDSSGKPSGDTAGNGSAETLKNSPGDAAGSGDQPDTLKHRIEEQEGQVTAITEKERAILDELDELDRDLNRMKKVARDLEAESLALGKRLDELAGKRKQLEAGLEKARPYVNRRLDVLYRDLVRKQNRLPALPDSVYDFAVQNRSLEWVLEADLRLIENHMTALAELSTLTRELEASREQKKALDGELSVQIRSMERETQSRNRILAQVRTEKKLGLASIASLKEAADRLDRRVKTLESKESIPGSGESRSEPDKGSLVPEKSSPEPDKGSPEPEKRSPESGKASPGTGIRRPEPEGNSFAKHENALAMPVKGSIISEYGPSQNCDSSVFTFQNGIDIKVDRGEPVMSVFRGRVLFAEWLKGYGNLLIIDHGDSYYTLYAHIEEFFKKTGDAVQTSEVIATAGDTGSIKGPCLHFEVRHHGKPENPMKWLKQGA